MKATLKNYRQAPRKVRLLADAIRGKRLDEALTLLHHTNKRAAEPMRKLLSSALANAQQAGSGSNPAEFRIKTITVDEGLVLHRFMPRAFGRATPIDKRTSHIHVELIPHAGAEAAQGTQSKEQEAQNA